MGDTLLVEAHDVVGVVEVWDVVEGQRRREVFVLGKSGSKLMFLKAFSGQQTICSAACD